MGLLRPTEGKISCNNINYSDLIFTTIFGLTIFLGILIKESVWSRSFYPLCIILLFLLPQKYMNNLFNDN